MTERATVVKVSGKYAHLELPRTDKCSGCRACNFGGKDRLIFVVRNDIGAAAGNEVLLTLPEKKPLLASVAIYLLPVVLLLGAALIASAFTANALIQAAAGLGGLAIGGAAVFGLDKFIGRIPEYSGSISTLDKTDKNTEVYKDDNRNQ